MWRIDCSRCVAKQISLIQRLYYTLNILYYTHIIQCNTIQYSAYTSRYWYIDAYKLNPFMFCHLPPSFQYNRLKRRADLCYGFVGPTPPRYPWCRSFSMPFRQILYCNVSNREKAAVNTWKYDNAIFRTMSKIWKPNICVSAHTMYVDREDGKCGGGSERRVRPQSEGLIYYMRWQVNVITGFCAVYLCAYSRHRIIMHRSSRNQNVHSRANSVWYEAVSARMDWYRLATTGT